MHISNRWPWSRPHLIRCLRGGGQGKPQINWHKTGGLDWWYGCSRSFENVEIMWFLGGVLSFLNFCCHLKCVFFFRLLSWKKKWQSRMHQKSSGRKKWVYIPKMLLSEILHQLIGRLSHYWQGFIHPNCGWEWDFWTINSTSAFSQKWNL